jgi:geranylgeranyl diphosphate synthase type 3
MNYDNIRSVLSQDPLWTDSNETALLEPFKYTISHPGKDIRRKLIDGFNLWLNVPADKLGLIANIVNILHTASLMCVMLCLSLMRFPTCSYAQDR